MPHSSTYTSLCASLALEHHWLSQQRQEVIPELFLSQPSRLKNQVIDNTSPLGLCLATHPETEDSLNDSGLSARHLVDGYIRELQLKAPHYQHRPVAALHWHHPLHHMDSSEITELMYYIGRLYRVNNEHYGDFRVRFTLDAINDENAALFRGLGFNQIEVLETQQQPVDYNDLKAAQELLHSYHFQPLHLTLDTPNPELGTRLRRAFSQSADLPPVVHIHDLNPNTAAPRDPEVMMKIVQDMKGLGYRVLGNDCFVRPEHALAKAQVQDRLRKTWLGYNTRNMQTVLGIGPGNISQEHHYYQVSPYKANHYLANSRQWCSIHSLSKTTEVCRKAKLITDPLLCYHHLDLKYLRDRHQLEPMNLLQNHSNVLPAPLDALSVHTDTFFQLSDLGISHLNNLCGVIIDHANEL